VQSASAEHAGSTVRLVVVGRHHPHHLTNLRILSLDGNQLRGRPPRTLTDLYLLGWFMFDAELLCAPSNAALQAQWAGIWVRFGDIKPCKTCNLPVMMR
jgi:hypothetical protein